MANLHHRARYLRVFWFNCNSEIKKDRLWEKNSKVTSLRTYGNVRQRGKRDVEILAFWQLRVERQKKEKQEEQVKKEEKKKRYDLKQMIQFFECL